jgi:hypothetical protein
MLRSTDSLEFHVQETTLLLDKTWQWKDCDGHILIKLGLICVITRLIVRWFLHYCATLILHYKNNKLLN